MGIYITILIVFIISFILNFKLVSNGNKRESKEEKLTFPLTILVSSLLALAPTIAIGLILFSLLGATNFINRAFSFDIGMKPLLILVISFLVYLFTIDTIVEMIVKRIIGNNMICHIVIYLVRIGIFTLIGNLVGLEQTVRFTIAVGIASVILLIEILYASKKTSVGT